MLNDNKLKIDYATLTTIWVSVPKTQGITVGGIKDLEIYLFGTKAKHLQPIIPIKWEGQIVNNFQNDTKKQVMLKYNIGLSLSTYRIDEPTLEGIKNNLLSKIKEDKNPFEKQGDTASTNRDGRQQHPFTVIDIKLGDEFLPASFKTREKTIVEVLNLLMLPEEDFNSYDSDVYEKIGMLKKQNEDCFLLNLSSLKSCFLTVSPKTALIIRGNKVKDDLICPNTLEAVSLIALCFVGYSCLLYNSGTWEEEIFNLLNEIKKPKQNENSTEFLYRFHDKIYEIGDINYRSSSLLQFHMSYVTSSPVAQNFFTTFSLISGLDEIHESLLTKLDSCNRLLNYTMDYYQFDHIKRLTPKK